MRLEFKRFCSTALLTVATLFIVSATAGAQASGGSQEQDQSKKYEFIDDSRRMEITGSFILQGSGLNYVFLPGGKDSVTNSDNSRFTGEIRFSIYFNRYKTLGLEGTFGWTRALGRFQQPTDYTDPDNPIIYPVQTVDHHVYHYGGNAIYNFGYLDVVPFLTFGLGLNNFKPAEGSSFPLDGTYYNITFSAGFKYFVKEWFGARVEVVDNFYLIGGDEVENNINAISFRFGAIYTF
jgi:hypothetical protein